METGTARLTQSTWATLVDTMKTPDETPEYAQHQREAHEAKERWRELWHKPSTYAKLGIGAAIGGGLLAFEEALPKLGNDYLGPWKFTKTGAILGLLGGAGLVLLGIRMMGDFDGPGKFIPPSGAYDSEFLDELRRTGRARVLAQTDQLFTRYDVDSDGKIRYEDAGTGANDAAEVGLRWLGMGTFRDGVELADVDGDGDGALDPGEVDEFVAIGSTTDTATRSDFMLTREEYFARYNRLMAHVQAGANVVEGHSMAAPLQSD